MDFMDENNEAITALYASAANAGTTNFLPAVAGAQSYSASQLMGGNR
jgi:N-acetylglucosamine-6-phosphate deacetylase